MNRSRKNQIKVAATAFIALMGGLTIWSCSQDELDDLQPDFYRYTPEEIATLRSLAEDYGVPDIKFATESPYPLPSIQEMENTFAEFSTIKQIINQPFETIDSTANVKKLRTKMILHPRVIRSRGESSNKDLGQFVTVFSTSTWLSLTLTISENKYSDVAPQVSLTANLELPKPTKENHIFEKENEKAVVNWVAVNMASISYECQIYEYEIVTDPVTLEEFKILVGSDRVSVQMTTSI